MCEYKYCHDQAVGTLSNPRSRGQHASLGSPCSHPLPRRLARRGRPRRACAYSFTHPRPVHCSWLCALGLSGVSSCFTLGNKVVTNDIVSKTRPFTSEASTARGQGMGTINRLRVGRLSTSRPQKLRQLPTCPHVCDNLNCTRSSRLVARVMWLVPAGLLAIALS